MPIRGIQLTVSLFHPTDSCAPAAADPAVGYGESAPATAAAPKVNWPAVIADGFALLVAIRTRNPAAIVAAVQQLLADLGVQVQVG